VTVIDNLWRGKLRHIEDIEGFEVGRSFHRLDLADPVSTAAAARVFEGCDVVIHLADIVAGIGYVFSNQYEIFRVNNLINTNVFQACAQTAVPRVLYAGTACSFPRNLQLSLDSVLREEQLFPAEPESAYGWSKLMGSVELNYLAADRGLSATTLMLHNVYGPNCDIDPKTSQVIPSIIRRMIELEDGAPLTVWGSGRQGRAFLHVDDVATAFLAALERSDLPAFVQIGPERCTSIRELVEMLRDHVVKRPIQIRYDTTKPEGDIGRSADYALARRTLGWEPRVGLVEGLEQTFRWIESEVGQPA
jgi:nucleoside-diphosphate-sugar epimerase